jgi:predicted nucleotidyltransferase
MDIVHHPSHVDDRRTGGSTGAVAPSDIEDAHPSSAHGGIAPLLAVADTVLVTLDLHEDRLAELCRRYGVAELSVFGSVARGDDGPGSDVDLLYVLAPTTRLGWKIVDLKFDLEKILGRPVDLVPKSGLKWLIRDRVLAEARVLYAA